MEDKKTFKFEELQQYEGKVFQPLLGVSDYARLFIQDGTIYWYETITPGNIEPAEIAWKDYTFVQVDEVAPKYVVWPMVKLTDDWTAKVTPEYIQVGCTRFDPKVLYELVKAYESVKDKKC